MVCDNSYSQSNMGILGLKLRLTKGVLVDDNVCLMYIFYILNVLFPVINMAHPHIILSNVVREHKNYYYYSLIINTAGTAATWMGGSKNIH